LVSTNVSKEHTTFNLSVQMMFTDTTGMYADALFMRIIAAFTYIPYNILQGYKDYLNVIINSITSHNTTTIKYL